jgi:large subunit ribosomal protein L23
MNSFEVIQSVRLTEKSTILSAGAKPKRGQKREKNQHPDTEPMNRYTLAVHPGANKVQIRQAVEELFKVKVVAVNTMNCFGKARRKRTSFAGASSDWKKAIVTLKQGDQISLT